MAPLNRGAFFFASFLMVETGHWSGGGTSNHPEVPVESSAMLLRKQKLWMRRPNFFYEMIEYGLYGR
jgi:hypothetical protein